MRRLFVAFVGACSLSYGWRSLCWRLEACDVDEDRADGARLLLGTAGRWAMLKRCITRV
jgi:hypothetical protein